MNTWKTQDIEILIKEVKNLTMKYNISVILFSYLLNLKNKIFCHSSMTDVDRVLKNAQVKMK